VETYETEEQRVEAIKNWWRENGRSVVVGLVLGVGVLLGWRGWSDYQESRATSASVAYMALLEGLDSGNMEQVQERGREIVTDYPDTAYAVLASLTLARAAVDAGDLESAAARLRWVTESGDFPEAQDLARLRLARVLLAQGKPEEAMTQVERVAAEPYRALSAEVRGDIHLEMGARKKARAAWREALEGYRAVPGKQEMVRMKLDDTAAVDEGAQ